METYLLSCRNNLALLDKFATIHLVVGNESCDLDSAVAAIVNGYLKQYTTYQNQNQALVLPLLNIDSDQLKLKSELLFWLQDVIQLDHNLLICRDEINLDQLKKTATVLISLVDHNEDKRFASLGKIVEVIDHHQSSTWLSTHRQSDPDLKTILDPTVGSCCTLVAEILLENAHLLDAQIALLIYGPIILDTICFSSSAKRFNQRDSSTAERLETILGNDAPTRDEIYQQLVQARNNISHLSLDQVLSKDLKVVEKSKGKIGVPSVSGVLLTDLKLDDKLKLLEQFSCSHSFAAIVIMAIKNDNPSQIERQVAVFSVSNNFMTRVSDVIESEEHQFELELISENRHLKIYKQKNVTLSRKKMIPVLETVEDVPDMFDKSTGRREQANGRELKHASPKSYGQTPESGPTTMNSVQVNPESVYGSYIEDSYTGELVGDYQDQCQDDDDDSQQQTWTMNGNSEIEFEFDSFGPESIIYTGHAENEADKKQKQENEDLDTKSSEESEKTVVSDSEVKIEVSGDQNDLNEDESNGDQSPVSFKRNVPLTQSQRRKIIPTKNFSDILNSTEDVTNADDQPGDSVFANDEASDERCIESDQSHVDQNQSGYLEPDSLRSRDPFVRQPSIKRKIEVNMRLISSSSFDDVSTSSMKSESATEPSLNSNQINELTAEEEYDEYRTWKPSCPIGPDNEVKHIDMKTIEPYKRVISHGGYYHHENGQPEPNGCPGPAIIVFSACYLPDRSRKDYEYIMDHLFMYVLTTLHNLVADDYLLIYFHNAGGGSTGNNMPTFGWLKRCYYMIDRKLKKNLKGLYLVHPTFWLKTMVIMSKPFISSKFSRKLRFVSTLSDLNEFASLEHVHIPQQVQQIDFNRTIRLKKKFLGRNRNR